MTSRLILSFLILNILTAFSGQTQVTRNFEDRVSYNVNGNITMVGNTLLTCDSSNFWCPYIQAGIWSGSNNRDMVFVNVDSAAGYSNSSSATLTIPNGASVLHAELYWSGRHGETANNRDKIRLKAPGSGMYVQVTANTLDTFGSEGASGSRPYQASADVTQIVNEAGSGDYIVADLKAKTGNDGLGFYGGWAIAVVYQDNTEPFRRLMLFDGAAKVTGTNTVSITTDNLVTPFSGSFNTYLGALVWEGDQSLDDDSFVFEGNTLSDSLNPANNYWNSSITAFNSRVNTKNPDYVNQLAMDLVMTDVSGLLSNGKTQANIDFVTNGDSYFPHVLAFVTDLYLPDFDSSMDKTATDLNGGDVEPGDVIEYRIAFENTGQDVAINTVVTDALPVGLTYVDNSLEIVTASAGPAGSMSDSTGDDSAEYDVNNRTITFWVGNNAGPNQGGDFLPGESAVVKFLATVDNQNSGSITNSASIAFNAQTTPSEDLSAEDDAMINVVASAGINVTKTAHLTIDNGNPGTADAGDEITFNISVENTGNMSMSNIVLNDDMAPLGVTCPSNSLAAFTSMNCDSYTYTVTQNDMNTGGTIDNTVDLTAVDGASNNHQDSDTTQTVITLLAPVISSPSDNDLLNDNTPTISGTGQPGAQIDVLTNQGGSCQATVNAQGTWSCDISPPLSDGSVVISAFASDGGSNQSATTSVTVELDSQAPAAPGVDAPTNGQPITGTGEPGATVTVITDNGDTCTAVVQANGTWSCDLGPDVVDGDTITVTQEDEAGNGSNPTVITDGIDTQAPTVALTAPVDGDLSNDNTPTVSGTSEAGAAIIVTIGGEEVCNTVTDSNGDWSCDVTPAVNDGSVQIDVTATDAAGNTSNPETVTITVDTMKPDAPTVDAPTNGQPITGTGEPGATVNVSTPGGASCSATVQADGSWACTLTGNLVDDDDITATQTDAANNTSDPTEIPGGLDTQAPTVSITAPVNGDLSNDNTPTVSGTSEADAEISVTIGGVEVCSAVADSNGNWSCDVSPAVNDGSVQIDVTASDAAGNTSNPVSVSIKVDTTAPAAPGIMAPTNGQPVTGTGEPGATVTVVTESGASCTAVVQPDGSWSCTLSGNLVDGDDITVSQEDAAGNTSDPTVVAGGLDTQAPNLTITAPVNGDLTNNNTPTVSGTSEAGAVISVTIGGVEVCTVVADSNGDWSCDVSPAVNDGSVQIDVTATDAAGNTSNPESVTITVDTMKPDTPVVSAPTNGQPITGTGEPGATVNVSTPGGASCSAIVQPDGSWSCTLTGNLVDGDDITATQTDPAGNESDSATVPGGLDTQAPDVSITAPVNDDLTNNNTPTVSGTSEAGAAISVTIGGVEVCTAVADSNGDWSCDVSPAVNDGSVQIDVTATDVAGNTSNPEAVTITVDTMKPDAPVVSTPTNGQPIIGTGEPGATVNVTTPGGASCSAMVQPDGSWSCTLTGNLVDGDDIIATQTDPAGNESDQTEITGGLDTQAPAVPTIDTPQNGTTINNASPLISGTAEAGSTVTVSDQSGNPVCVSQTNSSGQWSCTPSTPLADGLQTLQAVARDAAGNDSDPATVSFTVNSGAWYTLEVNAPAELVTTEAGGTDSFTIALPLTPTADVTVNISSSDTTEGTVSPTSVTFTTANWNQPVTITVTGVDDNDYDLDQSYTIDFSTLSSQDSNYNGAQVNSINAVNEDDDAQPDLSVFITNCINGSLPQQPITYYLTVSNEGNKAIQGARLTTVLPGNITTAEWDCATQDGQVCSHPTSGQGEIDELINLDVNESMLFTMNANVDGTLYDFIDVTAAVVMPSGETDVNAANNQAEDSDLLYQFLYKDGFECAAPGTIESTNLQLEQLLNLQ